MKRKRLRKLFLLKEMVCKKEEMQISFIDLNGEHYGSIGAKICFLKQTFVC